MITLITGLPGASKTLYTLDIVSALAKKENRPVFQSGINGLTLPWAEIDAERWFEAPPGAIVVIDECQRVFRSRSLGKDVPDYVRELETHRHKGIDLFMITQHPMLADSALRRLSGKHLHIVRKWGTQSSTVHEWPSVKDNCDKNAGRVDSIKHGYKFNKEVFNWYKSAEIHTVKRSIPARVYWLGVIVLLIAAAVWYMVHFTQDRLTKKNPALDAAAAVAPGLVGGPGSVPAGAKSLDPLADAKQYVYDHTPRVFGMASTAPRYDQLTQASIVPVPALCVSAKGRCQCYSQQGTRLAVSAAICGDIVAYGFFEDFERSKVSGSGSGGERSSVASGSPVAVGGASVVPSAALSESRVVEMPVDGFGLLGKRGAGVPKPASDG